MVTQMEEKIANLKSLNELLLKETWERRQQIDKMAKEKERAEAEATRVLGEKRVAEEAAAKAEMSWRTMVSLAEEVERLRETVERAEEEKGREVGLMRTEIEGLRTNVGDLERANAAADGAVRRAREEESRLKGELEGVVKEKRERDFEICELKKAIDLLSIDLSRERKGFQVVTRERDEIRKRVDVQMEELREAVNLLSIDLGCKRKGFEVVTHERDEIRKCVDVEMEELRGLRARLHEQEQRNVVVEEEFGRVQVEMRGLVEERKEREIAFESLRIEKLLLESEKAKQVLSIAELQEEVVQLRATISALKEKEKGLRSEIYELGKCNTEALEKQELLRLDFGILVEEKRETEENLKLLLDEKVSITTSLEVALLQLKEQKNREDGIVHEKVDIEQKSVKQEFELLELRKEISRLQDSVSALEDLGKSHTETNKQLLCEAKDYQDKLANLTLEKEATQKELDSKRNEELSLRHRAFELEKSVDERERELVQLRKESSKLFEKTKGTKSRIETLMEEKRSLERSLSETEEDFKNLRSKMKSYELYAVKISELLSDATKVLCPSKEAVEDGKVGFVVNADNIEKELNLVGAELDAIKKTYMSKDEKVEELMKELEVTKNSLKEAHQKKSFWTLLSSATTVVVAASLAYYSRVR
ncbi:hypothetical protein Sjap_015290 [Stephania japonica]|uniref:Uncharacterized protein n=1 Tax=Stephania japonica TaxID=461633 RepID=A0AAP0IJX2_9MAGN